MFRSFSLDLILTVVEFRLGRRYISNPIRLGLIMDSIIWIEGKWDRGHDSSGGINDNGEIEMFKQDLAFRSVGPDRLYSDVCTTRC